VKWVPGGSVWPNIDIVGAGKFVVEQMGKKILIVDDEISQRAAIAALIERWGFTTKTAADGEEALEQLQTYRPDAIVTDLLMPRVDGRRFIARLREEQGDSAPPVIVLTAYGNIETAIEAVHEYGAFWFVEKPLRPRAFRALIERAVAHGGLTSYSDTLQRQLSNQGVFGNLRGSSKSMQEVFFQIRQAAPTPANVLITGESGTGKELVARAIHEASSRRSGPFVALNCAALPEPLMESELFGHEKGAFTGAVTRRPGVVELADQGTLFLDEIGDMPSSLQSKLLRVLETRRVRRLGGSREHDFDIRVVAATNRALEDLVRAGQFREDLFFRLHVIHIAVPPLRERLEDIPLLCEAILTDLAAAHGIRAGGLHPDVLTAFCRHEWRGNVRELRNVLERALVVGGDGEIRAEHLPAGFGPPVGKVHRSLEPTPSVTLPVGTSLARAEQELIAVTLTWTKHNRTRAAELLGIDPKTLYNKLRDGPISGE
jgi:DNA-binding NtrC family response regulator